MSTTGRELSERWQSWLSTSEGEKCAEINGLENSKSQEDFERFLRNRLECAFQAGWRAHGHVVTELIKG